MEHVCFGGVYLSGDEVGFSRGKMGCGLEECCICIVRD